jgi:hypothetical protein
MSADAMNDVLQPVARVCRDCGQPFEISVEEQEWLRRMAEAMPDGDEERPGVGWHLPARCSPCRAARRAQKYGGEPVEAHAEDEWLTCISCGEGFLFGGRDRDYFARQGFVKPRRCRPCREARRAG